VRSADAVQRTLIILGLVILAIGLLWPWLGKLPFGRLPGDIVVRRDQFSLFFPVTSMVVLSLVVTLILWLFRR
jgi:formate hydrogenlyase subunit 3/multisubunit Na+/H+ antiporter MnhD subunit